MLSKSALEGDAFGVLPSATVLSSRDFSRLSRCWETQRKFRKFGLVLVEVEIRDVERKGESLLSYLVNSGIRMEGGREGKDSSDSGMKAIANMECHCPAHRKAPDDSFGQRDTADLRLPHDQLAQGRRCRLQCHPVLRVFRTKRKSIEPNSNAL